MKNRYQPDHGVALNQASSYFELQAYWGTTNHLGGLKATNELVQLCNIDTNSYVLVIGCGTGKSAVYLVRKYGCRVVGIDISERMVELSKRRASKNGVEDRVEFKVADAKALPFPDALFDGVICESVNVFIDDKSKAIIQDVIAITRAAIQEELGKILPAQLKPMQDDIETRRRVESANKFVDNMQKMIKDEGILDFEKDIEPLLDKFMDDNPKAHQEDLWEYFLKINHNLSVERLRGGKKKEVLSNKLDAV